MLEFIQGTAEREEKMIELGIEGKKMLSEIATAWRCSTENVASYLHRLQERKKYAYLVDGKGYFRIFKDLSFEK
jgi:MarR-like DNA-binding transcriptional regulator SgrR of sgrS sRNA